MLKNKHIYLVISEDECDDFLDMLYGCFDTFEKAEAFRTRFKKNEKLKIIEKPVNPGFLEDKNRNCYLVELRKEKDALREIIILNDIESSDHAENNDYDILRDGDGEAYCISAYILASSKKEAFKMARKLRDKSIAKGEWEAISA